MCGRTVQLEPSSGLCHHLCVSVFSFLSSILVLCLPSMFSLCICFCLCVQVLLGLPVFSCHSQYFSCVFMMLCSCPTYPHPTTGTYLVPVVILLSCLHFSNQSQSLWILSSPHSSVCHCCALCNSQVSLYLLVIHPRLMFKLCCHNSLIFVY